jgi:uncharacterized protein
MQTILITGASGLLGKKIRKLLVDKGYRVKTLSTNKKIADQISTFYWNIDTKKIDEDCIKEVDYIIHLAGANIAEGRWTKERKKQIIESRTISTQLLFDTIKKANHPLKAFVSASAIGYYGSVTSEKTFTEEDLAGRDFLGNTCLLWETEVEKFNLLNIRTVRLRIGVVLSKDGGAFTKLVAPIKWGLGAALGNGKQYMPWIHIDDLVQLFLFTIEKKQLQGIYNAVAPNDITNYAFAKALSNALKKPFFMPNVPAFILKLFLGEMATIVLDGSKVSCNKIISEGFKFNYTIIQEAVANLIKNEK